MRFGITHRVMIDALAGFSLLALVGSGRLDGLLSLLALAGYVLALASNAAWQARAPAPRRILAAGALVAVLAAGAARLAIGPATDVFDVLLSAAACLQILRLATRVGASHDAQIIVLSVLHLAVGAVAGEGIGYGVCLLAVVVVAPGALFLSHLRREVEGNHRQGARDRTGLPVDVARILRSQRVVDRSLLGVTCLISIPVLLLGITLFAFAPRFSLSLPFLAGAGRAVPERLDLGAAGLLRPDPTIAMRVRFPGVAEPPARAHKTLYLRGAGFDTYDGRVWSESRTGRTDFSAEGGGAPAMQIELEAMDPPVLFAPLGATGLRFDRDGDFSARGIHRGPEGEIRYDTTDARRLRYAVLATDASAPSPVTADAFHDGAPPQTPPQALDAADRARYLALPEAISPRLRDLAASLSPPSATPLDRARRIEAHLRAGYAYDREAPSARQPDPLDHFLFEAKRGHCQFFATAMAVLLRASGVPARQVTGFLGGTYNRFGRSYVVRRSDAHAWVEAYVDGLGWTTFDPTPPADPPRSEASWGALGRLGRAVADWVGERWDQHVAFYDREQRASLLQAAAPGSRALGWTAWALALAIGGVAASAEIRRRRARGAAGAPPDGPTRAASRLYAQLDAAMRTCGRARPLEMPPLRHAEAMVASGDPLGPEVLDLTRLYLGMRFGGVVLSEEEQREVERRVGALGERGGDG